MRVDKSDEGRYYCHAETKPGVVESGYTDLRVEGILCFWPKALFKYTV